MRIAIHTQHFLGVGHHIRMTHGDPTVTRLGDHFPWVGKLDIPVHYTGYIRDDRARGTVDHSVEHGPLIVVSVGGDARGALILRCAMKAWRLLRPASGRMLLFAGAFMTREEVSALEGLATECGTELRPFVPEFVDWLGVADLSISRVGYNTCVAVLAAGTRSLLIPARLVPDQRFRANRLQELGLAMCLAQEQLNPELLAGPIDSMLAQPRPEHGLDLDGAERTRELLEAGGRAF
jgi:predicted glycosyltransferase